MFRADLHCHSTYSDGTCTPKELILRAKERGLQGLSITDHDTIDAYPEAEIIAKQEGILLGAGVELSSRFENGSVHILGYGFSLKDPGFHHFCKTHRENRKERNKQMLEKLKEHEMYIEEKELIDLFPAATIGRPHIAYLMMQKGYVNNFKEAFERFLGDGKSCYVAGELYTIDETIHAIRSAGGKAVLAHPHLIQNQGRLKKILAFPFDGIECYYSFSQPQKESAFLTLAKEKGWIATGGSDFHGEHKPGLVLGSCFVNLETFERLFKRI